MIRRYSRRKGRGRQRRAYGASSARIRTPSSCLHSVQRLPGVRRQRVALVGRHALVVLRRPRPVAELLVGPAQLVERVGPTLGAVTEGAETLDRQGRLVQLIEVQVAKQLTGLEPRLLVPPAGKFLRL